MEIRMRSGDSFSNFSSLFNIPFTLLADSNPQREQNQIKPGEKIKIPGFISVPYRLKGDDELHAISAAKNISPEALLSLNQTSDLEQLQQGAIIYIPERVTAPLTAGKAPYDYQTLTRVIESMQRIYPFISVTTIGKSVLGKPIQEIRIGNGMKKVHMNASFHANEWITTMVLMSLLNKYLLCLTNDSSMCGQDVNKLYEQVELSIVPMVNPDGVDLVLNGPPSEKRLEMMELNEGSDEFIHWKANIRGIDLNRQFPANWDSCRNNSPVQSPCARDFPGAAPLSEPEAAAMSELVYKNAFDYVLAFHTQGEEFYWGYEGFEPLESEQMAVDFERKSGYKAIRYVNSHAGFKDWFIQEFKRPGFTIELGRGINPLPLSQFQQILQRAEEIFTAALSY
ncbi:LysM peptidoglycan-binding domain-containing protein [Bacillus sp. BRMEA1]|uniref:M14 family metallopeptidase n=1 Tax=Neobacillus endophyticus TaxID=2738405 RepID=UPI0015645F30|nr:M14 family metallopeptidase [Neobacillus endophyticus]NRD80749.1 LysM peptidoglycan-binding domain-containing protein [Neobacillus endophyticus]